MHGSSFFFFFFFRQPDWIIITTTLKLCFCREVMDSRASFSSMVRVFYPLNTFIFLVISQNVSPSFYFLLSQESVGKSRLHAWWEDRYKHSVNLNVLLISIVDCSSTPERWTPETNWKKKLKNCERKMIYIEAR